MSFDRVAYMKAYNRRYKSIRKARERSKGVRENKPTGISISYKEDPKAYRKAYYTKYREKLLANTKVRGAKWRAENGEYKRTQSRIICAQRKAKAFEILGGKCKRCGFSDHRALQVDHIHGSLRSNGERKRTGRGVGEKLYKEIINGTNIEPVQLLCANCNWIKRVENNECARCRK